ncbi:sensor histidine kinase [Niallia sp. 01092]|uniref:sensor histidine kinase n=1 Tax=unclassified Niallia TaxID=2837522 RepID=UPI003FD0D0EA
MKTEKVYWGLIILLAIFHVRLFIMSFYWNNIIFISLIAVIIASCYLISSKIIVHSLFYEKKINGLLWLLQLLVITLAFVLPDSFKVLAMAMFMVIEICRYITLNSFVSLKQNVNQLEEERIHINETFRIVRSERHDFLKHIAAVHFMMESKEYNNAKQYLDQLVEGYKETNLSIKGEKGAVAGVLHSIYRQAKASGIEVAYDLDLPVSTLPMADKELVAMLSNLLTNGLEACLEWRQKYNKMPLLSLQFYKRSGIYILICRNDSLSIPVKILDELFNTYGLSTKSGANRGYGTKIIGNIVKQHHGFLDFVYKEEQFMVKIKFPALT